MADEYLEWDRFYTETEKHWNPDTAFNRYRKSRGKEPMRAEPSPAKVMRAQHEAKAEQRRVSELQQWAEREALKSLARTIAGVDRVAPIVTTPYRTRRSSG